MELVPDDVFVTPIPLPGLRFIECADVEELERRKDEVAGNIVRVRAPLDAAKPLAERLAAWGAHDAQVVPVRDDGEAAAPVVGGALTLDELLAVHAQQVGPGLSPLRAASIGRRILEACHEE
jgi:hypothetical protein